MDESQEIQELVLKPDSKISTFIAVLGCVLIVSVLQALVSLGEYVLGDEYVRPYSFGLAIGMLALFIQMSMRKSSSALGMAMRSGNGSNFVIFVLIFVIFAALVSPIVTPGRDTLSYSVGYLLSMVFVFMCLYVMLFIELTLYKKFHGDELKRIFEKMDARKD